MDLCLSKPNGMLYCVAERLCPHLFCFVGFFSLHKLYTAFLINFIDDILKLILHFGVTSKRDIKYIGHQNPEELDKLE